MIERKKKKFNICNSLNIPANTWINITIIFNLCYIAIFSFAYCAYINNLIYIFRSHVYKLSSRVAPLFFLFLSLHFAESFIDFIRDVKFGLNVVKINFGNLCSTAVGRGWGKKIHLSKNASYFRFLYLFMLHNFTWMCNPVFTRLPVWWKLNSIYERAISTRLRGRSKLLQLS